MNGWFPIWMVITVVISGSLTYLAVSEGRGVSYARQVHACDVVVKRLMTTTDPAEVQRDAVLVDHLNCDVVRRAMPFIESEKEARQ